MRKSMSAGGCVDSSDRGFQQVSFVNSIATTKGGKHVDSVADNIVKHVIEVLKRKTKVVSISSLSKLRTTCGYSLTVSL